MVAESLFGVPLGVEILAGIIVASVLFVVDRGARMVGEMLASDQDEREREAAIHRRESHFLSGVPADDAHEAVEGFIDRWPRLEEQIEETHRLTRKELGNGGKSTADTVRKLDSDLASLRGEVGALARMMQAVVGGRSV